MQVFFCGSSPNCTSHGSRWALEEARRNVELHYPVVGLLEDMDATAAVAEDLLPDFFGGMDMAIDVVNRKFASGN